MVPRRRGDKSSQNNNGFGGGGLPKNRVFGRLETTFGVVSPISNKKGRKICYGTSLHSTSQAPSRLDVSEHSQNEITKPPPSLPPHCPQTTG